MIMKTEIYPRPLRLCFFANTMLLIMKNISENDTLTEPQKKTLEQGLDFFKKALNGKKIIQTLKLSKNCVEELETYTVASKVLMKLGYCYKKHIPKLTSYKELFERIIINSKIKKDNLSTLQELIVFFKTLGELSWEKVDRPTEVVRIVG